jgi:hypothetical protein
MRIHTKILLSLPLVVILSGCAAFSAIGGFVSSLGTTNNSGSQKTLKVDADLSNQQGDNEYSGSKSSVETKNITGKNNVSGESQQNYEASEITINQSSLLEIVLISFLVAMGMCLVFWWLPRPKHAQKIIDSIKSAKNKTKG